MHPSSALSPISSTDEGIMILSSEEQLLNAHEPIIFTDDGIVNSVNDVQPLNEKLLMKITEFGILTFFNDEHLLNDNFSIELDGCGIIIFSNDAHPSNALSSTIGRNETDIFFSFMHPKKHDLPISFTVYGIDISSSEEQLLNDRSLIEINDVGFSNVIFVKFVHELK